MKITGNTHTISSFSGQKRTPAFQHTLLNASAVTRFGDTETLGDDNYDDAIYLVNRFTVTTNRSELFATEDSLYRRFESASPTLHAIKTVLNIFLENYEKSNALNSKRRLFSSPPPPAYQPEDRLLMAIARNLGAEPYLYHSTSTEKRIRDLLKMTEIKEKQVSLIQLIEELDVSQLKGFVDAQPFIDLLSQITAIAKNTPRNKNERDSVRDYARGAIDWIEGHLFVKDQSLKMSWWATEKHTLK